MTKLRLVSLTEPCSACVVIDGLIREMLAKLSWEFPCVAIEYQILDNLKDIRLVEGLEVEKFPALFLDDVQMTAGSLPMPQQLRMWFENATRTERTAP